MKDKDGRLVVSEKDCGKFWKEHMVKIMNVENEWDQMVKADMVEELCQRVLDGKGMLEKWKTSVVVLIFEVKRDVMDCGAYTGRKLLEHAMKIVEKALENRIRRLVTINDMQFGFMPGKGTTHALHILRRMQEEF